MNRRTFLLNSGGLSLAAAAPRVLRAADLPSIIGKIKVGVIGVGSRSTEHVRILAKMPDVEIAYLCDVNRAAFTRASAIVQEERGALPKRVQDMREIFADKSVDAVFIAPATTGTRSPPLRVAVCRPFLAGLRTVRQTTACARPLMKSPAMSPRF